MLKKRYLEMRADKLDLFNTKPTEKYHGTVVSSISDNGKRFYVGTWN